MNNYLIPANAKRGNLIFSIFRKSDLILFGVGLAITFILLMIVPLTSTIMTVLVLLPAGICALLVTPMPYYHNVLTALMELVAFINNRQKYIWRGWCSSYGESNDK